MTAVPARFYRNEAGIGECLISSGVPVPPGLVPMSLVTGRKIKVLVGETELPVNISALRGTHQDGSIRSVLIQFRYAMAQGDSVEASVVFDGGVRTTTDIAYTRPYWEMVFDNNNVILPEGAEYLCSTLISLRNVVPPSAESASEEKFFTTLAENRFNNLYGTDNWGTASYDQVAAKIALWCKKGSGIKYQVEALREVRRWMPSMTPSADPAASPPCKADAVANPDGREDAAVCGIGTEWHSTRMFSLAAVYLLTGYRDLWGNVAYIAQRNASAITSREIALESVIGTGGNSRNRYNSLNRYRALIPAFLIDATIPVDGQYHTGRAYNWTEQLGWTVDAILDSAWNIRWIPFSGGAGVVPPKYAALTQGSAFAVLYGVYSARNIPELASDVAMPETGWLRVANVVGAFSTGPLTGILATASGPDEDDYRNGFVGVKATAPIGPGSGAEIEHQMFQTVFPTGFLMDYYLYVKRDSRIPIVIKNNLDVVLANVRPSTVADYYHNKGDAEFGYVSWVSPYNLEIPINTAPAPPWNLPMYARMTAFVIKTLGDSAVNGRLLSSWYEILIDTANANPKNVLGWSGKIYGEMYGLQSDTPWIMSQESVLDAGPTTVKTPVQYTSIPDEGIDPIIPDPDQEDPVDPDPDPEPEPETPTTSGPILRTGSSLLRVGDGVLRVQ